MKMKMKMKDRSHKYDINRLRFTSMSRHRHKYGKSKKVSVWWCLYALSNDKGRFGGHFIKKLSNTEAELKKSV